MSRRTTKAYFRMVSSTSTTDSIYAIRFVYCCFRDWYYKTKNHVKYVVFRLLQLNRLACLEGFEPPTYWFVASHSIQLSYKHIVLTTIYILPLFISIVKAFFEICRFTYLSYHLTLIIMHIAIFSFSY